MFDLIGDVHGYADHLEGLLARLGYHPRGGVFGHPEGRKAVFIGDLIDRGPAVRRTLRIARAMVTRGCAMAVLGNHEYNALCFASPSASGGFLRPHTPENFEQHAATLDAFRGLEDEWHDHLRWFAGLPLFLDLGPIRVVHACWDSRAISEIGGARLMDGALHTTGVPRNGRQRAVRTLLKGPQIPLPAGVTYRGSDGREKTKTRIKWWLEKPAMSYRGIALQLPIEPPDDLVPEKHHAKLCGYGRDEPPVFFGHYGYLKEAEPLAENVACVDLGVVRGGPLCAYRWSGESRLSGESFVTFMSPPCR